MAKYGLKVDCILTVNKKFFKNKKSDSDALIFSRIKNDYESYVMGHLEMKGRVLVEKVRFIPIKY
jgi:hypothetical protein